MKRIIVLFVSILGITTDIWCMDESPKKTRKTGRVRSLILQIQTRLTKESSNDNPELDNTSPSRPKHSTMPTTPTKKEQEEKELSAKQQETLKEYSSFTKKNSKTGTLDPDVAQWLRQSGSFFGRKKK